MSKCDGKAESLGIENDSAALQPRTVTDIYLTNVTLLPTPLDLRHVLRIKAVSIVSI